MENNNSNKESKIGVINTDNTIGKNIEGKEFEGEIQIEEINIEDRSEKSVISKQDVYEMISEKII